MSRVALEADAEGSPRLTLADQDREAVAELLADLLVSALEREGVEQSS